MKSIHLTKMTGAGNSFLILDMSSAAKKNNVRGLKIRSRSTLAKQLCSLNWGLGADGFLILEKDRSCDVRWDFYNADGSRAEMCGNAARCVGHYLYNSLKGKKTTFSLKTKAGTVQTQVRKARQNFASVEVSMTAPSSIEYGCSVRSKKIKYDFIDSGVPHAVVQAKGIIKLVHLSRKHAVGISLHPTDSALQKIVDIIRQERCFKKTGTNVTFYEVMGQSRIASFTFERGVAGFTLACGTGAVAAATSHLGGHPGVIDVEVPGGRLQVDSINLRPKLIGPSLLISEIDIYL